MVGRDEALAEAVALLHPLHEDIVKLSATDIELAVKLEVLVSEKSRQVTGPVLVQAHSYLHQTHDLLAFFADRLKVQLREQGARHDLVDAVFALGGQDDLLLVVRRVEALGKFLDTDDGKNLLAGVKRATNIIRIEEKKDKREFTGAPDAKRYQQAEETALAEAIATAKKKRRRAIGARRTLLPPCTRWRSCVPRSMLSSTRSPSTRTIPRLRENRLKLLNEIREATRAVADFSRIEGLGAFKDLTAAQ